MKENIMQERLSIGKDNPVRARFFNYSHFTYPWHFHQEYEIIYVKQSSGLRYVADSIEQFNDGDLVLLGQDVPHFLKNDAEFEAGNPDLRATGVIIQFEKDFMGHAMDSYPQLSHIKALLTEAKLGIHFDCLANPALVQCIELLPLLQGTELLINLLTLLENMSHCTKRRPLGSEYFFNHLSLFTDSRIEKVISYVNFHYKENISLSEIAALASMNTSAFCRYFKNKSGKSFMQYIMELRIGFACKLLNNDEMNIFQVSVACGFNTISHFNNIFKRVTGFSPTDYRCRMRA